MKKLGLLLSILTVLTGSSFAQNTDNVTDTFPPDFGKGKTYLYVVTVPGYFQVNNALKKMMEKNYNGAYEIIDTREFITATKKKGFRNFSFAMIYEQENGYFRSGERVGPQTDYSCGVTNMETGTLYRLPYTGGNYKKVMEKYIKRLEEIRKNNQGSK